MKKQILDTPQITISGVHRFIFRDAHTNAILEDITYSNMIMNSCTEMLATKLAGGSNDCNITYAALGTGTGTIDGTETTMFTELERKLVAGIAANGSNVEISSYFGPLEAIGTLTEWALFGQAASSTPDSGTMISHLSISKVKTALMTLSIDSTITFS